jgi:hypothetical protein
VYICASGKQYFPKSTGNGRRFKFHYIVRAAAPQGRNCATTWTKRRKRKKGNIVRIWSKIFSFVLRAKLYNDAIGGTFSGKPRITQE